MYASIAVCASHMAAWLIKAAAQTTHILMQAAQTDVLDVSPCSPLRTHETE